MSNQPRFEVFPEKRVDIGSDDFEPDTTGEFVWHFKDANGKLTHIGGEPFTRREDAHRSIIGSAYDYAKLLGVRLLPSQRKALVDSLPIVDLDADGKVIDEGAKP